MQRHWSLQFPCVRGNSGCSCHIQMSMEQRPLNSCFHPSLFSHAASLDVVFSTLPGHYKCMLINMLWKPVSSHHISHSWVRSSPGCNKFLSSVFLPAQKTPMSLKAVNKQTEQTSSKLHTKWLLKKGRERIGLKFPLEVFLCWSPLVLSLHNAGRLLLPRELLHCVSSCATCKTSRTPNRKGRVSLSAQLLPLFRVKKPQQPWTISVVSLWNPCFQKPDKTSSKWKSDCATSYCWFFSTTLAFLGVHPFSPGAAFWLE